MSATMKRKLRKLLQSILVLGIITSVGSAIQPLAANFVFAETTVQELADDANAKLTLDYNLDQEAGIIHWTMAITKHAATNLRQMQFALAIAEDDLLVADSVQAVERTFGVVGSVDENWYYAGDFSSEAELIQITFDTRIVPEQMSYTLSVSPRISEKRQFEAEAKPVGIADQLEEVEDEESAMIGEQQFLQVGDKESYQVTVQLPEKEGMMEASEDSVVESMEEELELDEENEILPGSDAEKASIIEVTPFAANTAGTDHPDLEGAFADAVLLNERFTIPSPSNTTNSAKFDANAKLAKLSSSSHNGRIRSHLVSSAASSFKFKDLQNDIAFSTYMKFDQHSEGIAFFMHNQGDGNHYDPLFNHYRSDALGVYKHFGSIVNITNYMKDALVLEFDNRKGGLGDAGTVGAHIALAKSSDPNSKKILWKYSEDTATNEDFAFENDSWWKLDLHITPDKKMFFQMTDLSGKKCGTINFEPVNISDYLTIKDTDNVYYGFSATSLENRTNNTSLFMTDVNHRIDFDFTHTIKDAEGDSIDGKVVAPGDILEHEVTVTNVGSTDLWLTANAPSGIELGSNGANALEYTTIDSHSGKFRLKQADGEDIGETVHGVYWELNEKFYPNSSIKIAPSNQLIFTYQSKVNEAFDENDIEVLDRVGIMMKVGTETSQAHIENNTDETDFKTIEYMIHRNTPPTVELKTVDEYRVEKTAYCDLSNFYYQFDYEDQDPEELTFEIKINGNKYSSGDLDNATGSGAISSPAFKIDMLSPATTEFIKIGENTITVTLSDGQNIVEDTKYFTVDGFTGFELAPNEASWICARTELDDELTAVPRQGKLQLKLRDTAANQTSLRVQLTVSDLTVVGDDTRKVGKERLIFNGRAADGAVHDMSTTGVVAYAEDKGLLLKLKDSDPNGTYQGTMTWTIVNGL